VVTIDWLKNCEKKKKFLPYDDYKLKCFHGIKISLFGFDESESADLKKLIKNHKGEVLEANYADSDVIVVKPGVMFNNIELAMIEPFDKKLVIQNWINACIENKKFQIFTDDFKFKNDWLKTHFEEVEKKYLTLEQALNEFQSSDSDSDKQNKRRKTQKSEEVISVMRSNLLIFSDFVFYISNEFNKNTKEILFKAISLGRGVVFKKLTPLTTHIICNSTKENFSNRALSFGAFYKPTIVNPNWIIDSLLKGELHSPEKYRPISNLSHLMSESNIQKREEIIINSVIISTIFKNEIFYIFADSYSIDEYVQIKEKIIQNSGVVIDQGSVDCSQNNAKPRFIIINDGYSPGEMASLIEKKINNYQYIMSHRYIDICIEKRELVDLNAHKYIHVLPFQHPVSFPDFLDKKVTAFFYNFSHEENTVMEYLIETLGGKYELSNKTTHIIVKESIDKKRIIQYRTKYNPKILYVKIDWILECLIEGKVAKEDKFLVENSYDEDVLINHTSDTKNISSIQQVSKKELTEDKMVVDQ
jgi:hypothetical protein